MKQVKLFKFVYFWYLDYIIIIIIIIIIISIVVLNHCSSRVYVCLLQIGSLYEIRFVLDGMSIMIIQIKPLATPFY